MEQTVGGRAGNGAELIKDTDTAGFMADVIEASRTVPVIVDFWAPWCGPCKQLGPAIEKAVREARGRVRLVKVNIDDNQQLAQQLRIQSIPTVYAFRDGQPVDGFVGALPDSQVKSFITRVAGDAGPSAADAVLADADDALGAGDAARARTLYGEVLRAEPDNARAAAGLVRALIAAKDTAGARTVLESLTPAVAAVREVEGARAALELAEHAAADGGADTAGLRARLAADPKDHQARFELAMALYAGGDREGAVGELLELVRRNRTWNDEAARKQLVKLFEAFGATDPLTVESRRRLSSILFS